MPSSSLAVFQFWALVTPFHQFACRMGVNFLLTQQTPCSSCWFHLSKCASCSYLWLIPPNILARIHLCILVRPLPGDYLHTSRTHQDCMEALRCCCTAYHSVSFRPQSWLHPLILIPRSSIPLNIHKGWRRLLGLDYVISCLPCWKFLIWVSLSCHIRFSCLHLLGNWSNQDYHCQYWLSIELRVWEGFFSTEFLCTYMYLLSFAQWSWSFSCFSRAVWLSFVSQ